MSTSGRNAALDDLATALSTKLVANPTPEQIRGLVDREANLLSEDTRDDLARRIEALVLDGSHDTDDDPHVHNVSDVILPVPYRLNPDTGQPPHGTDYLHSLERGSTARDAEGRQFRVLGPGFVQGSRILRDPDGRAFQADVETILAPNPEDPHRMSAAPGTFNAAQEATITATLENGDRFTFPLDLSDGEATVEDYMVAARGIMDGETVLYGTLAPVNPGTHGSPGLPPINVATILHLDDAVGVYVHLVQA